MLIIKKNERQMMIKRTAANHFNWWRQKSQAAAGTCNYSQSTYISYDS